MSKLITGILAHVKVLDTNWQRLILTHLKEKQHIGVLTGSVFCSHGAGFRVNWDEVNNYKHL